MPLSQIWLPDGNTRTPFLISKIICFLGDNQYATVYYLDEQNNLQSLTVTVSLFLLEKKLLNCDFLRATKSALINIDYISKFFTKGKGKITVPLMNQDFILWKKAKPAFLAFTKI